MPTTTHPTLGDYTTKHDALDNITTVTYADGISVDYIHGDNEAIVWNADGDYDARYDINNTAGIEQEVLFIRSIESQLANEAVA